MPCTVIVGAGWGDEGKGKIVSYLALKDKVDVAVRTGSINAGHTVIYGGKSYKLRLVPSAFVYENCELFIGPGANIHPGILLKEIEETKTRGRIWVDYKCSIIEEKHILRDRTSKYLAEEIETTGSGVGPSIEDRVKRIAKLAEEIDELKPFLKDVPAEVNMAIDEGKKVLVEGTQGLFLSLYYGTYPYVTSRDTSASGVCSEAGVPPTKVDNTLVVFKAYMTRVGKGPLPGEISEEEAKRRGWFEMSTVTGRPRRSAPLDFDLARRAVMINGATQIAVTKIDVLFPECRGVKQYDELSRQAKEFIEKMEKELKTPVVLIGTGPNVDEIIDLR